MSARDIIVRPIITEKTSVASADNNTVTFEVAKNANKTAIAQAIVEIYHVKPVSVNTVNVHPKKRRVGRYEGMTRAYKKAYVKFAKNDSINIKSVALLTLRI